MEMLQDMAAPDSFVAEEKDGESAKKIASTIEVLMELGRQKGFDVEADKDYGAGPIDVVWHIKIHHALRDITCGFLIAKPLAKTLGEAIARGEVRKDKEADNQEKGSQVREIQ